MKQIFCTLFLAASLVQGALAANAADYCSKPIRVAMFEYGVLYRSSTGDGVDSRLLDVLAQRSGCVFERVLMPRARIWPELHSGTLDMATAAIATPERDALGYLMPYLVSRNVVLIHKAVGVVPRSLEAFNASKLRVGMVRGFKHEAFFDNWLSQLAAQGRVKEVADVSELFRYLERGIVDAVVSQPLVFQAYVDAQHLQRDLVQMDWAPPEQSSVGNLIFSRKSFTPAQAARWETLVQSVLKDKTLLKILQETMPLDQARGVVYRGPRMRDGRPGPA